MNWFYLHLMGTRHAITRVHEPALTHPLGTKKWHIFNSRINTDISFDEGALPVVSNIERVGLMSMSITTRFHVTQGLV